MLLIVFNINPIEKRENLECDTNINFFDEDKIFFISVFKYNIVYFIFTKKKYIFNNL